MGLLTWYKTRKIRSGKLDGMLQELTDLQVLKKDMELQIQTLKQQQELNSQDAQLAIKRKQSEFELEKKELKTLLRLDHEQKLKQIELDHQRQMQALEHKLTQEQLQKERDMQTQFYAKLSEALSDLHVKAVGTTEFMETIAIKMFDRAAANDVKMKFIENKLDINEREDDK